MEPQIRIIFLCVLACLSHALQGQPFEPILTYRLHYHSPVSYDNPEAAGADKFSLLQHTVDVLLPAPVKISQRDMLVVSGVFYNRYHFSSLTNGSAIDERSYTRLTFKGGINYKWRNSKHSTLLVALPTWAADDELFNSGAFQMGGLVVHSFVLNDRLTLKGGLYYNREFFGNFFMPLAGVDWRLNNGWYIFGLLPGAFNIYKHVNDWFAFSFSERAPNGSLRDLLNSGDYVRIGRSPYVLFMFDLHFTPVRFKFLQTSSDITFSLSVGHSVFRTYELYTSEDALVPNGLFSEVRSSPYARLSVSMRVWQ